MLIADIWWDSVLRGFGFKTFFILKCLDFKAFVLKFFYFKALHF